MKESNRKLRKGEMTRREHEDIIKKKSEKGEESYKLKYER